MQPGLGSRGRGRKLMGTIWNLDNYSNKPKNVEGGGGGGIILIVLSKFYAIVRFILLCTLILAGLFEIQSNIITTYY